MAGRTIGYNVPLIPQTTGMGCWAAGVAMIRGWRDRISIDPKTIAQNPGGVPYINELQTGLNPSDVYLLQSWGMRVRAPQSYTVEGFAQLLERHGPLWVASAVPGAHIRVITGMEVDEANARVFINDPWEKGMTTFRWPNKGAQYIMTYADFVREMETLARQEMGISSPIYVAHL